MVGQDLGQHLRDGLLREGDGEVEVVAVVRHRRQVDAEPAELLRQLPRPVGTEVEEDRGVPGRVEPRAAVDHDGDDELVGHAGVVARLHRGDRVGGVRAVADDDRVESELGPVPALVAVHRVVAARDGRDPVRGQRREVVDGRVRRDVAPVGERVDPRPVGHPLPLRQLEQRKDVGDVRVDAAGRDEPEQVHVAAALARAPERRDERLVLEEGAVADGAVDALEILVEHAARADRQVADLGVAHLAGRQPDRLAGRAELGVRELAPEPVEDRCVGELDRVARARRRDPPAVEDHERDERERHVAAAAASHIAANESIASDAPPTSPPSTSGCANSSAAFSGLTEPP